MECVFLSLVDLIVFLRPLASFAEVQDGKLILLHNLRRLCIMAHTLRIASARRITAVVYVPQVSRLGAGSPRLVNSGRFEQRLTSYFSYLSIGLTSPTPVRTRRINPALPSPPSSSPTCSFEALVLTMSL